eukprot:12370933-Heterocapsa_arctica.AAC.1
MWSTLAACPERAIRGRGLRLRWSWCRCSSAVNRRPRTLVAVCWRPRKEMLQAVERCAAATRGPTVCFGS